MPQICHGLVAKAVGMHRVRQLSLICLKMAEKIRWRTNDIVNTYQFINRYVILLY